MPSLIYQVNESTITFRASGGSAVFTPTSLAAGAGRQGALHDLGSADRARWFHWRAFTKFITTPVVGEIIRLYLKTSDGTNPDNDDGTGDAAVSAEDKLRNLHYIGRIVVDEASTTPTFVASSLIPIAISAQHVAPVWWNETADALSSTAADHGFDLLPVPDEIQ